MSKLSLYIWVVIVLAALGVAGLYYYDPVVDLDQVRAAVCFAALGLVVHFLPFTMRNGVAGSSALLPFLTTAVLAPSWIGCAAVVGPVLASRLALKGPNIKTVFNIAQVSLATSIAILAYRALGGEPLTSGGHIGAYAVLVLLFYLINSLAVAAALALSQQRPVLELWKENSLNTVAYDIACLPFVYAFAWVYSEWSFAGVAGLAIPAPRRARASQD